MYECYVHLVESLDACSTCFFFPTYVLETGLEADCDVKAIIKPNVFVYFFLDWELCGVGMVP